MEEQQIDQLVRQILEIGTPEFGRRIRKEALERALGTVEDEPADRITLEGTIKRETWHGGEVVTHFRVTTGESWEQWGGTEDQFRQNIGLFELIGDLLIEEGDREQQG